MAYGNGYAMEASLLIAKTLQTVQLADGLHAYLRSVAECAVQAYLRTDVITTRIWQWESQLRKHDEHQYEYTIPDSIRRLKETLTQVADAITAQIPAWTCQALQVTREQQWRRHVPEERDCQWCEAPRQHCICAHSPPPEV